MIRSDRLFFGVIFGAMFFIPIIYIIDYKYDINIMFLLDFSCVLLLLPYVFIKILFPDSKASKWFNEVPEKILHFYKSTYDKIKIY